MLCISPGVLHQVTKDKTPLFITTKVYIIFKIKTYTPKLNSMMGLPITFGHFKNVRFRILRIMFVKVVGGRGEMPT